MIVLVTGSFLLHINKVQLSTGRVNFFRILTHVVAASVPHDALPPVHGLAGGRHVEAGHGGRVLGRAHGGLGRAHVAAHHGGAAQAGAEAAPVKAGRAAGGALENVFE